MNVYNEGDVKEILNWINTQKFLPTDLSKKFVQTFLLGCDGDVAKTKTVITNYFFARQSIPEIFTRRDPMLKENIVAWKASCFVPLRGKHQGCRVFLGTVFDSNNFDFIAFVKQEFMCFDLLLKNNEWENGKRILIISYDAVKHENVASYTEYVTRKSIELTKDSFLPGKLIALHNVHIPPFMKKIHERFRPHLTREDQKLIHYHKTLRSLYKHVNPDILPLEFGGNAGSLRTIREKWYNILTANREFFLLEEEKRVLETKISSRV